MIGIGAMGSRMARHATVELWTRALAALGPAADHTAIARWFEDARGMTLADS